VVVVARLDRSLDWCFDECSHVVLALIGPEREWLNLVTFTGDDAGRVQCEVANGGQIVAARPVVFQRDWDASGEALVDAVGCQCGPEVLARVAALLCLGHPGHAVDGPLGRLDDPAITSRGVGFADRLWSNRGVHLIGVLWLVGACLAGHRDESGRIGLF